MRISARRAKGQIAFRNRRVRLTLFVVALIVSGLSTLGGLLAGWAAWTFPSDLARHPVVATAVVTDSFINGFGGDPAVEYTYSVNGRSYHGWGESVPGKRNLLSVTPGTVIPIRYALTDPSHSCTCNPAEEDSGWSGALPYALFILPMIGMMTILCRQRWRSWWLGS
jgi:hypothetical protein